MNKKEATDKLREETLQRVMDYFDEEDVQRTKSGTVMFPTIDALGNEVFVTITVQIPKGSRNGEAYDGYTEAVNYQLETKQKEEERILKEKQKQKKISRDEQRRADAKAGQEVGGSMIKRYEPNAEPKPVVGGMILKKMIEIYKASEEGE